MILKDIDAAEFRDTIGSLTFQFHSSMDRSDYSCAFCNEEGRPDAVSGFQKITHKIDCFGLKLLSSIEETPT